MTKPKRFKKRKGPGYHGPVSWVKKAEPAKVVKVLESPKPAVDEEWQTGRRAARSAARRSRSRLDRGRPYDLIFEDDDLIVVSKRGGLLTVPFKGGRVTNLWSLVNQHLREQAQRALVVHRIDRYTSGLVVFAKNKKTRMGLIEQFRAHSPRREYLALVRGKLEQSAGNLTHYLALSQDGFRQKVQPEKTKHNVRARLRYWVLGQGRGVSLVRVRLDTGLKNQIRVQFLAVGHPIVGDRHYAAGEVEERKIDRQALHASLLGLRHPETGRYLEFKAELPQDFAVLLARFGLKEPSVSTLS